MKIIRFQLTRFIIFIALILLLILILVLKHPSENSNCLSSKGDVEKVESLLEAIQHPLSELKITYFLCYNSLWGALKFKAPLPWQNDLELCALNKELSAIDEGFLIRTFKRHNLVMTYNSGGGYYSIAQKDESLPKATLTVFEEDSVTNQMRRVGWMYRMLPPTSCDEIHCFPPELITSPLPTIKFGKYNAPVPQDGIEIQKYLFPNSWWKDVTPPPDCLNQQPL